MSAVVLDIQREEEGKERLKRALLWVKNKNHTHLPDSDGEAFPTGHAVLHFVILSPLSGQTL